MASSNYDEYHRGNHERVYDNDRERSDNWGSRDRGESMGRDSGRQLQPGYGSYPERQQGNAYGSGYDSARSGERGSSGFGGYGSSQCYQGHSDDWRHHQQGFDQGRGNMRGSDFGQDQQPGRPRYGDDRQYDNGHHDHGGGGFRGDADRFSPRHQSSQQDYDPDYGRWRNEQMRNLDSDYDAYRGERYQKFSEDFNTWRSKRAGASKTTNEENKSQSHQAGSGSKGKESV